MKTNIDATAVLVVAALGALGVGAYWLYKNRRFFNPADEANLANQGVAAVVHNVTGGAAQGGEDSLGGVFARIREAISGDNAAIEAMKSGALVESRVREPLKSFWPF